jgi:Ca-activated chloride channel family protein
MSDSPVHFVYPELTHALWVWACAVLALVLLERRGSGALDRLVVPELQDRLVDRPSRWRRWARVALLGTAGFAMIVALMQPQWGSRFVATPRVGAEIMIALDVSRSMLADDAKPSRLERAKAEISDLLSYLDDDHVGLIAFAGRATVLSPMTPDKSFLRLALDRAGPHVVSRGGTSLAEPILRAVAGMGEPGPAQRALILITDGEDHDSFAMDAARTAAEAGIKIITIGFGDEVGSQIHLRDPKTGARSLLRDAEGRVVVSRLDGDLLREIALATDGAFVPAGTGVLDLASIYDAHIAQLTRGQLDRRGRMIRDEAFQFFVLLAIVCLVAAVSITSARGTRALRVVPLAMVIVFLLASAAPVNAQSKKTVSRTPNDANDANDATATKVDPRTTFNRGNEKLEAGDPIAATTLLRAARRDATDDVLLRYAATYNLGVAATARADALEAENASEALAALYEAADWFREAVVARPDESDPRHNLDVTLRRALILSDEIARENGQELDAELDAMIEAQRRRVAEAAGLLEAVVRPGELGAAEKLRPAFRDSATQQRLILADANALGDRVAREREQLAAVAEQDRSPDDILKAAQLEGVLVHLDSAIERMGQTRRQLRQRRAERAYRRGSSALGDLKRARDQLRSTVPQIGILLAEVGRLASATSALATIGLPREQVAGTTRPTVLPAFLTRESAEADSEQIEARVAELATRLALAVQQATPTQQSTSSTSRSPLTSGTAPLGGTGGAPGSTDQGIQAIAFQEAAPLVASAARAMERVTAAIGEGRYDLALLDEVNAGEALAAAEERFFDLRQLLNVAHSDEQHIAKFAGSGDPTLTQERGEDAVRLTEIQSRNSLRGLRLEILLERERDDRIADLEAERGSDAMPTEEPSLDPVELERRRFELADQLLALAADAMRETTNALRHGAGEGAPDWPRVSEAATRATEHLDAIRTLFFSIAEHVRKLTLDQLDVRDRTQDMIALSVTESSSNHEATSPEATDAMSPLEAQSELRGPETLLRAQALAGDQQKLESRGGEIADALFVQAEEMGQALSEGAGPEAPAERERIRRAAEHVALAQLAMQDASGSLGAESAPLAPAQDAQTLAVDELKAALVLLSPPPKPDESKSEQDESQSDDESQEAGDGDASGDRGSEDAGEESLDDPSQLLQGVRDRDAERRRERDREEQRRRTEPVDKDW